MATLIPEPTKLANYVRLFGELPPQPPIILDTPEQEQLFQALKARYKSISIWLSHWLLGETYPEEVFAGIELFKSEAKLSEANYSLALSVYPRSKNRFLRTFESPEDFWFAMERQFSELSLELSGITGYPEIISKRKGITSLLNALGTLADRECPTQIEGRAQPDEDFLLGNLMLEALSLSKEDPEFDGKFYIPYMKAWKHALSQTRDRSQLKLAFIDPATGKLSVTEKHKKLPKL